MVKRGNKKTCEFCGIKYYDLGVQKSVCPKCKRINSSRSIESKSSSTKNLSDKLIKIDLLHIDEINSSYGSAILSGKIELPKNHNLKKGWYALSKENISKGLFNPSEPVIYLKSPPLRGIKFVLSSNRFPGIGIENANNIVNNNANSILNILEGNAESIKKDLSSTDRIAKSLASGWKISLDKTICEIFFRELGFSFNQLKIISKEIGLDIIKIIEERPFSLLGKVPRLSFEQLEEVYNRLNRVPSDLDKSIAALEYWLRTTEERRGHTCAPLEKSVEESSKISRLDQNIIKETLENEIALFPRGLRFKKEIISSISSYKRDTNILKQLERLKKHYSFNNSEKIFKKSALKMPYKIKLSNEQIDAINSAVNSSVSIITGGPGSGKSTLIVGLVKAFEEIGKEVFLCAPTGRAAKRLSEYSELKRLEPSTIHMHLTLLKGRKAKLFDAIIIDESSMIDVKLLYELLEVIPNGCSMIFVGDADQLPPIGPGQPFKDMIESEYIPVSILTGNYRQESFSDIIIASRSIINGDCPQLSKNVENNDFLFIESPKGQQAKTVLDYYFNQLPLSNKGAETENLQILSPMHRGEVGIKALNKMIQNIRSNHSSPIFQKKEDNINFYVGDKVIQTSNNYELMVMNGDIGTILRRSGKEIVVEFDEREVHFSGLQPYDLDLAYAISIHKSQGSEYPGIIIPINSEHIHMLSRNLLYTGITRGKKKVIVIGEENIFKSAIKAFWKDSRFTNLVSVLKNEDTFFMNKVYQEE